VPILEPDVKATVRLRLELDCMAAATCPVILNVVPVDAIAEKQEDDELLTAVTVPVRLFPFWVKFTARPVLDAVEDVGANVTIHMPLTVGVRFDDEDEPEEYAPHAVSASERQAAVRI
jgi:hypothetical protein